MSQTILVIGPSWIGDMILAQSLYKYLHQQDRRVQIDVLAPDWSLPLLRRMSEVRQAMVMPLRHGELGFSTRRRIGLRLRGVYTRAIVLPRSLKSALLPWFARIPVRTGFLGELRWGLINDVRSCDYRVLPSLAQRFVSLGASTASQSLPQQLPQPALRVENKKAAVCLRRLGINASKPILALAPGASYGPSKQWPAEFFAEAAQRHLDHGWSVWIFGAQGDVPTAEKIAAQLDGEVSNLCGRTGLEEAVDLLAQTQLLISNDSGLMHVAAAVGVPVIAIYGSTTPNYTPPMTANKLVLYRHLECSPCWQRTCRYGHYHCLNKISPDRVTRAATSLAKTTRSFPSELG